LDLGPDGLRLERRTLRPGAAHHQERTFAGRHRGEGSDHEVDALLRREPADTGEDKLIGLESQRRTRLSAPALVGRPVPLEVNREVVSGHAAWVDAQPLQLRLALGAGSQHVRDEAQAEPMQEPHRRPQQGLRQPVAQARHAEPFAPEVVGRHGDGAAVLHEQHRCAGQPARHRHRRPGCQRVLWQKHGPAF
jgi:hypothetical protein